MPRETATRRLQRIDKHDVATRALDRAAVWPMTGSILALPDLSITIPAPPGGPIRLGSDAHKALFCRTLLTTFNPYKPAIIDWPQLDQQARDRLVGLPIWDIAVQTEGKAKLHVASYGHQVSDPLLKRAIELDAFEEGRHKHVLANLCRSLWHQA